MQEKEVRKLDAKEIKDRILGFLNIHGPSLPVQIARHINMNTLFASAFLSEMASEKTIIISNMKVGGSPLYYTKTKENMLENFSNNLNPKEKEAFELLKNNKILSDEEQHPAIRVALRSLKDFAFPFKRNDKIFWRYFLTSENELEKEEKIMQELTIKPSIELAINSTDNNTESEQLTKIKQELEEKKKEFEKLKQEIEEERKMKKERKKTTQKEKYQKVQKTEEFLNEVKETLNKKQISIKKIEFSTKDQVIAIISSNNKELLLFAYNKKKIDGNDILKAYKKASSLNLNYSILTKAQISKKLKENLDIYKRLESIETIENSKQ